MDYQVKLDGNLEKLCLVEAYKLGHENKNTYGISGFVNGVLRKHFNKNISMAVLSDLEALPESDEIDKIVENIRSRHNVANRDLPAGRRVKE